MKELEELCGRLEPAQVLTALLPSVREALAHLDEEERLSWFSRLLSDGGDDKLGGMVNL